MPEAVIVAAARTPIGRAHKGSLVDVDAFGLGRVAVGQAVLAAPGSTPPTSTTSCSASRCRAAATSPATWPCDSASRACPGLADNRHCASGLSAVQIAAGSIRAGMDHVVIAGGTESLELDARDDEVGAAARRRAASRGCRPAIRRRPTRRRSTCRSPSARTPRARWASRARAPTSGPSARTSGRSRAIDEGCVRRGDRAGRVAGRDGSARPSTVDEHPRRDTTLEKLAALQAAAPRARRRDRHRGQRRRAQRRGRGGGGDRRRVRRGPRPARRSARFVSWASVGSNPARTGMAPDARHPEGARARRARRSATSTCSRSTRPSARCAVAAAASSASTTTIVNVNGSGCGLGHPIAATGARMVVTMLHELRRRGGRIGCVSMCAGGGMGSAMVIELL